MTPVITPPNVREKIDPDDDMEVIAHRIAVRTGCPFSEVLDRLKTTKARLKKEARVMAFIDIFTIREVIDSFGVHVSLSE